MSTPVPTPVPQMPTVGVIARRFDEPVHRIEYIIESRDIRPAGLAGNARVFSEAAVARIAGEPRRNDGEDSLEEAST